MSTVRGYGRETFNYQFPVLSILFLLFFGQGLSRVADVAHLVQEVAQSGQQVFVDVGVAKQLSQRGD